MNELRLLKMAARAGKLRIDFDKQKGEYFAIRDTPYYWNAGLNTKQAFELADSLRLMIDMTEDRVAVTYGALEGRVELSYDGNDRMAINRLAILMLAAEVGESM